MTDERGVSLPLKNGNSIKVGIGQALPPGLADVLLSALKISPDGPVLVNPFYFDHPDEIGLLERAKQKGIQSLLKKLRENESDGEEKTRDRK